MNNNIGYSIIQAAMTQIKDNYDEEDAEYEHT